MMRRPIDPDALFDAYPGIVLELDAAGTVLYSNGVLDGLVGLTVSGRSMLDLLDRASSSAKLERLLARAVAERMPWELIFRAGDAPLEPTALIALRPEGSANTWLIEATPDPERVRRDNEVLQINSELVTTQRDLARERARLARALEEVERRHREAERLNVLLRERYERIEAQNEELRSLTEELEQQRRELERSNRDLDEFTHAVSHDLRTPLRNIGDLASWLREDLAPGASEESRQHLGQLKERVERLQSMISGVLRYSRVGRQRSEPEEIDVGDLLRQTIDLLNLKAGEAVHIEEPMPVIRSVRAPLQQVLLNLIDNGVKHAHRQGAEVTVSAHPVGDAIEFTIRDNGPGVPHRAQAAIWRLFHVGHSHDDVDGSGIGLALVKRIVEEEGGRVWVESPAEGGATFRFLWPCRREDLVAGAARGAAEPQHHVRHDNE